MFRLTAITLAALYVVLAVFGRDPEGATEAIAAAPEAPAAIAPVAAVAESAAVPAPDPAPAVTPVRFTPMPGPSLKPAPEYRAVPAATGHILAVDTARVNVRSGPGLSAPVIDSLARGEEVLVVAERDGWARIRIEGDGIEGWVSRRLLRPAN